MLRFRIALAAIAVLAILPPLAGAQSTTQFPVQFDFLTPGARSLALAGAFIGAADDATAAFTNPAGLSLFGRGQVSFEGRLRGVDTPFLAGGRVSGIATGIGLDTVQGPVYREDTDTQFGLSFASIVIPIGIRGSITGYRHEVAGIENSFFSEGVFQRRTFLGITDDRVRELPLGGTRKVDITNYGGAIGLRINDALSVGGGISVYTFNLDADFARFGFVSSIFGEADRTLVSATATQDGDDIAVSFNAGALITPAANMTVGLTYRRGPRFNFSQRDRVPVERLDLQREGEFKVPDVIGVGLAWRAPGNLMLLVDYDRVQYSQLKRDFIDIQAIASGRSAQLRIDDANEVHGGVEWTLSQFRGKPLTKPWFLRGGAWLDPDHTVRYEPTPNGDELDVLLAATLPGGKDLVHYTFGAGIQWSRRVSVNAATDLSSRTRQLSISTAVWLGSP